MRKAGFILVMAGIIWNLFGCGTQNREAENAKKVNEDNVGEIVAEELQEKYGESFQTEKTAVNGKDIFSETNYYTKLSTQDGAEFEAWYYPKKKKLLDTFAGVVFHDDLIDKAQQIIGSQAFVQEYKLDCFFHETESTWNRDSELDEFLLSEDYLLDAEVVLSTKNMDEAAEQIMDLLLGMEEAGFAARFDFVIGEKSIVIQLEHGSFITEEKVRSRLAEVEGES